MNKLIPAACGLIGILAGAYFTAPPELKLRASLLVAPRTAFTSAMSRCLELEYDWNRRSCVNDTNRRYKAGEYGQ